MIDELCHVSWFVIISHPQNMSIVDTFIQSFDVIYLNIFYLQTSILYTALYLQFYNIVIIQ